MTAQFHEGQDVEVWKEVRARGTDLHQNFVRRWCKAKIVGNTGQSHTEYMVDFHDGTRAVFFASHIRAVSP